MEKYEKEYAVFATDFKSDVYKAQQHIKEAFNIESKFDQVNDELTIIKNGDALSLANAKEYVTENIDDSMLKVVYSD